MKDYVRAAERVFLHVLSAQTGKICGPLEGRRLEAVCRLVAGIMAHWVISLPTGCNVLLH